MKHIKTLNDHNVSFPEEKKRKENQKIFFFFQNYKHFKIETWMVGRAVCYRNIKGYKDK